MDEVYTGPTITGIHAMELKMSGLADGQIACHYLPSPIIYDLRNKSIHELVMLVNQRKTFRRTILERIIFNTSFFC